MANDPRHTICQLRPSSLILDTMLTIQQSRWLLMLKGELHKAPVKNPQKILDLGTGTGIWALDIAEYENAHTHYALIYVQSSHRTGNSPPPR